MRLLLDTHAFLWLLREPLKLPPDVRRQMESTTKDCFVSVASLWEIAIKVSLNKLTLPGEFDDLFPRSIFDSGLSLLAIDPPHLAAVRRLPLHHRDPFDRLLVAQAEVEDLLLVSGDQQLHNYGIPIIW